MVRRHLEYCMYRQGGITGRTNIICLKKYKGLRDLIYEDMLKECGLTPEARILRGGGQIEVFKISNCHENIDPNIYFKIKTDS